MQSARKTKMSFCLDIFTHFVVEAEALLRNEAGHCFGERDAECITCSAASLFVLHDCLACFPQTLLVYGCNYLLHKVIRIR